MFWSLIALLVVGGLLYAVAPELATVCAVALVVFVIARAFVRSARRGLARR